MRKIDGLALRTLGDDKILVAESKDLIDFNRLVTLNDSAAYIWQALPAAGFDIDDVVAIIAARYDVDETVARTDARRLLDVWLEAGIVENGQNH